MAKEVKEHLHKRGVATSRTTPYHPTGNSQCERYNGIIWKTIELALESCNEPTANWESVLNQSLHSIRSLLCTATNETPHERMFSFSRRSSHGNSLPTWLTSPGPVYLRRYVRSSKYDPLVDEVELVHDNPTYAQVKFADGRESTVSVKDLARCPSSDDVSNLRSNSEMSSFSEDEVSNQNVSPEPSELRFNSNPQSTGKI